MGRDPLSPSRRRAISVASAVALVVLAGCAPTPPAERVPDESLFAAIAGLDGVESSSVEFRNVLGYSPRYVGDVVVTPEADAMCVLFQTIAVLKQGRAGVGVQGVEIVQGERSLVFRDLSGVRLLNQRLTFDSTGDSPEVPDCTGIPSEPAPTGSDPTSASLVLPGHSLERRGVAR